MGVDRCPPVTRQRQCRDATTHDVPQHKAKPGSTAITTSTEKKLLFAGDALQHFHRGSAGGSMTPLPGVRRAPMISRSAPRQAKSRLFEIVLILDGKRIPLFLKML
jgi:hypothetical protein